MPWTVDIGASGGALASYPHVDISFIKRLNGVGWGHVILPGLGGASEPAANNVVRLIWNKGLSNQRVHFEGIILHNERLGSSPNRKVSFLDVGSAFLWQGKTGGIRRFEGLTPHAIIQGGGTPNNLLKRSDGTQVITYGSSASVPDKVDAVNPGTALDDFVADSTRQVINVQRLCLQGRYDGSSYGLEYFGQLEGANNSDPRFYLVKRKATSPSPAETFAVPTDIFKARRGERGLTALEAVRVIGGGHGASRIQSSVVGSGGLEGIVQDKSIINTTNATNMATRLQGLLDPSIEAVTAWTYKHDFASTTGDTVTLTQDGFANKNLRVFEIGYSLRAKQFIYQLGRPRPLDKDPFYQLEGVQGAHGTTTQIRGSGIADTNTTSDAALANNGNIGIGLTPSPAFDRLVHDGISVIVQIQTDTLGNYDLQVRLSDGVNPLDIVLERVNPQSQILDGGGRNQYQRTFWVDSALLASFNLDTVTGANVDVWNRTGGAVDIVLTAKLSIAGV